MFARTLATIVAWWLLCSSAPAQDISFRYGIIGMHDDSSLFVIDDNMVLKSGTRLKINFKFPIDSWFYVCYLSSEENYKLVYNFDAAELCEKNAVHATLGWLLLDDQVGEEQFNLIASAHKLNELEELLYNYDQATGKSRKRFHKRITAQIENLRKNQAESPAMPLPRRLEKAEMGGVAFRGLVRKRPIRT